MKPRAAVTLVLVLAVSAAARLVWLHGDVNVNEPDEFLHLIMAENFAEGWTYPRYDYSTWYPDHFLFVPPLPLYTAGLVFRLFGVSLLSFRAMNAMFGLASVAAFYALSGLYLKGLPRGVAVAAFALSPLALYESTTALVSGPAVFFLIVGLWAYVLYTREQRRGDLVVFAISLGATAACKQFGLLLGGLVIVHWLWCRVAADGPRLRWLLAALAIAVATFCILAPWVLTRPRDSLHFYLHQTVIVQIRQFLRGSRGGGKLLGLPYPELVLAHAVVSALGLVAFLATWRKRWDVMGFYGVLLALPICIVREVRYLGLALPALALFSGYLVAAVDEMAARRWRAARVANWALAVLLVVSLVPTALRPWHERSGLSAACRYVAERTEPGHLVMSNYWRHIIERFTGRTMPRDWLDGAAERLIAEGKVRYVILDESQYTRTVIHTTGRARIADWVRRTFPEERAFGSGGSATRVYRTDAAPPETPAPQ